MPKFLGHFSAQTIQQTLEQLEPFGFVFVQRITLGIATEAYNSTQVFERQKMLTPFAINRLQKNLLFDVAHGLVTKARGLFCHIFVRSFLKTRPDHIVVHAFFFGPLHHRLIDSQLGNHISIEPLSIPLIGIGFRRHVFVDQIVNHLMAHVGHDVGQVRGFHDVAALGKDHLALLVHHIVKLQKLLTNVKVTAFNLRLRAL